MANVKKMIQCNTLIQYNNTEAFADYISDTYYFDLYEDPIHKQFIITRGDEKVLEKLANTLKSKHNFTCHIENKKVFIENYYDMKNLLTLLKIKEIR